LEQDTSGSRRSVAWDELPSFIEDAKSEIVATGGSPDVVIVTGHRNLKLYDLFDYRTPAKLGTGDARALEGIIGIIKGMPIFNTWDNLKADRAYVLDLARSYQYVQTNPNAISDEDLFMNIEVLNFERALEMINKQPNILQLPKGPVTREEKVIRLQLQVLLHLIEAGRMQPLSTEFLLGVDLPPYDS